MVNGYLKNTEIKQGHKQKWYKKRFGFLSFLMFFQSTFYYNKGYNLPSKKKKKNWNNYYNYIAFHSNKTARNKQRFVFPGI